MEIKFIQDYLPIAMTIATVGFIFSTLTMFNSAKMRGYTPFGLHIKNKWYINFDIKFFSDLRKEYLAMGNSRLIPITNRISIYTLIICCLLSVLSMFAEYY
jgi:hypothetical protein